MYHVVTTCAILNAAFGMAEVRATASNSVNVLFSQIENNNTRLPFEITGTEAQGGMQEFPAQYHLEPHG